MAIARVAKEGAFVFWCEDAPDRVDRRDALLAAHLAYVEANFAAYRVAGPLMDAPAGAPRRSLFIITAPDQEAAWALMRGDPYVAGGLYARIQAFAFTPAAGSWIGGKVW